MEMEFESYRSAPGPKTGNTTLATHCNVPLKRSNQRAARLNPLIGQRVSSHGQPRKEMKRIERTIGVVEEDSTTLSFLHNYLLNIFVPPTAPEVVFNWGQQIRVARELWAVNSKSLDRGPGPPLPLEMDIPIAERQAILEAYKRKCFWFEAVLASSSKAAVPVNWWKKETGITYLILPSISLAVTDNLFVVKTPTTHVLASRDHLLILSDLAAQRYILKLYATLEAQMPHPSMPPPSFLDKLLQNGDLMLEQAGDQAYSVIKSLEPFCISLLSGDLPIGSAKGLTFNQLMCQENKEKAQKLGLTELLAERDTLIRALLPRVEWVSQCFGLYRLWGHPTVDPILGAISACEAGTAIRHPIMSEVARITNKFKEELIIRYIQKYNKWPELDVSRLSPTNVIRESYLQQGIYPTRDPRYARSHLALVSFKQIFPVDPKYDLAEFLSDKSMSLNTPELITSIEQRGHPGTAIERSVLVNWMERNYGDPAEFLGRIDKEGFPPEEASVGEKEKERELKEKPRMFGLMTIDKRFYIVLTESLIAEHFLALFPEIAMTDDEITLDKKRLHMAGFGDEDFYILSSLDFERWNLFMRFLETLGMFKVLDQCLGFTNLISRTHEMFEKAIIYLLNGSFLPPVVRGKLGRALGMWRLHKGGIEGLRQKGWTLWTIIILFLMAEGLPMTLELMGAGDNEFLKEKFPSNTSKEEMLRTHYRFLKRLHDFLNSIGPRLKLDETWSSKDLLIFGKYIIHNGVATPMSAKRISKITPTSNEDHPIVESALSSAAANLSAAVASSPVVGTEFFVYMTETTSILQLHLNHAFLQQKPPSQVLSCDGSYITPGAVRPNRVRHGALLQSGRRQPDHLYEKLLLFPRCLGGFPVANIYDCLIRGFPDDVTFAVASLKRMFPHAPPRLQSHIANVLNPQLSQVRNFALLFEQPTALNLDAPPAAAEARRNSIIDFLKGTHRVCNRELAAFLDVLDTDQDKILIDYLSRARPLNPRILGEIAGATVEARARHVAGQLQKTKIISRLASVEGHSNISSIVEKAELNYLRYVLHRCKGGQQGQLPWKSSMCSLSHVEKLRKLSWGEDIVGVDCAPPQEILSLEYPGLTLPCPEDCELEKGYVLIRAAGKLTDEQLASPYVPGPYRAYRGSVTRQKVSGYGDKLAKRADPLIAKTLKLFNLLGWGIPREGNLASVIKQMCAARTDIAMETLLPMEETIAGSVHHRLKDHRTDHGGAVPINPNYGSCITFDTSPLTEYSKGRVNVNLMFQSVFSYALSMTAMYFRQGVLPPLRVIHGHIKTSCCIRNVEDQLVDIQEPPPEGTSQVSSSPYFFVPKEQILPPSISVTAFASTLPPPHDPEDAVNRFHWSLAEECLKVLSPTGWDSPGHLHRESGLTMGWSFVTDHLYLYEILAFKICACFSGSVSDSDDSRFLIAVANKVDTSPTYLWKGLVNLIFAPGYPHQLVGAPYYLSISGSPCLTPSIFARNTQTAVKGIITRWANDPELRARRLPAEIVSSSRCGLFQHPSLLLCLRDWLLKGRAFSLLMTRRNIVSLLREEVAQAEGSPFMQLSLTKFQEGSQLIFAETTDVLSKQISPPQISVEDVPLPARPSLPIAATVLMSRSGRDLLAGSWQVQEVSLERQKLYEAHQTRLVANPSTGPYKILSLLEMIGDPGPGTYACLGDGGGGYTYTLLSRHPSNRVFYNTLVDASDQVEQAPPIPYIPALAGHPHLESRLINLKATNEGLSDLTHPQYPLFLSRAIGTTVRGVVCDAESPGYLQGEHPLRMAKALCVIAVTLQAPYLLFKTYSANPYVLFGIISICLNYYQRCRVIRSHFSDYENSEVFLYCDGGITSPQIAVEGTLLSGSILNPDLFTNVQNISRDCAALRPRFTTAHLRGFSSVIHPDVDASLIGQLCDLMVITSTSKELLYPVSLTDWIATSTTSAKMDMLRRGHVRQVDITHSTLRSWTIMWLVLYLTVYPDQTPLSDILEKGRVLTYPLEDQTTEFSLFCGSTPWFKEDTRVKVRRVSALITSRELKTIQRLRGIITHLDVRVHPLSSGLTRGCLNRFGHRVGRTKRSGHSWIRSNVQFDPRPPRYHPDAPLTQSVASSLWRESARTRRG